jgi:cysteine-rich repeat protein
MSGRVLRQTFARVRGAWCLAAAIAAQSAAASAATPRDQQVVLAAAGAVKIVVRGQGWLRVTQPALVAAGLDPLVDPAKLQIYADGVEQSIVVTGNGDASFTADEAIELYGVGRDTLWTDTRTYWLVVGAAGARVPLQAPPVGGAAPSSFVRTERLVERKVYLSAVRNGDESNFYAAAVSPTPAMTTIAVHHLDGALAAQAMLRVSLQGLTATTHAVDVMLGGTLLGTCTLDKQAKATCSFPAPNVAEGDNQLALMGHASISDFTALESVELDYAHTYAADGDALELTAPAATRLTLAGFSVPGVRVVDVTDDAHPVELAVTVTAQGAGNDARVDVPASQGTHTLYAFTAAQVRAPAAITADVPSSWAASHDGELVILSHASFLGAIAPLVSRRAQDGWSVQLVDLQDVYDEFGFGDKTAVAIRDFLLSARAHWRVPPRFVLLVGDATFDPRNFLGKGDFDFVPTKLIDTATMETASDDWFVDGDLDGVPEMAIGRLPVRTKEQAATVVQKTLAYAGAADLPRGGLFVTDEDGQDLDFSGASAAAAAKVSDIMPIDRFQRGQVGATPDVLLGKLGAGPFLVNYIGHGSVEVWDGLLTSVQASALTNTHASLYVVMNCLNGFFHDLYTTSLAEALLEAPQGGAVAVWASSTLAEFAPQPAYNQEFLMRLGRTSLGESAIAAKQAITDLESRRTWLLFGDPTLFGKPGPPPPMDAGADGAQANSDASAADGGASDGTTSTDAADGDAADAADSDAADAAQASDGMTSADASVTNGDAMASDRDKPGAPPAADGCGCRFDAATRATPEGLGLLLLGCVAAARRHRARRARRRRRWPLGLLALALVGLGWAPSAHAAYNYRKAITIDRTRIGSSGSPTTLTNYPLLLNITDSALATTGNGGHVQNTNGYDITFEGADTTTCGGPSTCTFKYEVESYTATTGQIIVWVQIPALKTAATANTTNTIIYVKYGDAGISSSGQNTNGTWDTNFKGVWHLNQNPGGSAPQMTDSTSTAANSTSGGSPTPATATGLISSGVSTSGTTGTGYFDYRSTTFNWTGSDTFTYSGWFKTSDSYGPLVSQRDNGAGSPVIEVNVGYDGAHTSAGNLLTLVRDNTGVSFAFVTGSTAVADGNWHLFTLTRSGGTIQLFLDGTSQGSNTDTGASGSITTGAAGSYQHIGKEGNWVQVGYGTTDQQYLAGSFDEYRISNTVRSTDWITTDYKTQSAPASTFSLGSETLTSCGDGSVIAGEACDDGNIVNGDGCSATCTIETGYTCTGTAPSVCTAICGDGMVAGSEACDDSNNTNGDGCSSVCTVEAAYACTGSPSVCKFGRFDYYKTIVFDHTKVGTVSAPATLTDYPILFSVTDPSLKTIANGGRMRNANAYDMVFRGLDTTTCGGPAVCTFAHEIEKYDATTGQLIAWVNIPGLKARSGTTDTSIQILFGNQAISTTTEQKASTWNSNFTGVWHLNQDPTGTAPQMKDSTSSANDGTSTALVSTTGQVGSGVLLDGTTSFMAFDSGTSVNTASSGAFTYSGWLTTTDATGGIFSLRSSTNGNIVVDIMVGRDGATTNANKLMALLRDDSGAGQADVVGATINDGNPHFVTVTHSGTSLQLYMDATSQGTATVSAGAFTSNLRNIGREGRWVQDSYTTNAEEYLSGTFDEFRASNAVRSIDWITTDYNNQSSPSMFYMYTTGSGGEVTTNASTEAALLALEATETCSGTAITWQTAYEIDTLGFNVYRELAGRRVPLNTTLIAGAGISGGGGHQYEFVDPGSFDAARTYWLEDVRFSLESSWYGPVAPTSGPGCGPDAPQTTSGEAAARPSPTPLALAAPAPGESARNDGAPDQLGGCSVGARDGGGGLGAIFAVAILARARRRRRSR